MAVGRGTCKCHALSWQPSFISFFFCYASTIKRLLIYSLPSSL